MNFGCSRRRPLHLGVVVEAGGNVRVVVGVGHVGPEQERSTCGSAREEAMIRSPARSDRHDSAVGPHTRIPTRSRRVGHCACGRQPPLLIKPQILEVRSAPREPPSPYPGDNFLSPRERARNEGRPISARTKKPERARQERAGSPFSIERSILDTDWLPLCRAHFLAQVASDNPVVA